MWLPVKNKSPLAVKLFKGVASPMLPPNTVEPLVLRMVKSLLPFKPSWKLTSPEPPSLTNSVSNPSAMAPT